MLSSQCAVHSCADCVCVYWSCFMYKVNIQIWHMRSTAQNPTNIKWRINNSPKNLAFLALASCAGKTLTLAVFASLCFIILVVLNIWRCINNSAKLEDCKVLSFNSSWGALLPLSDMKVYCQRFHQVSVQVVCFTCGFPWCWKFVMNYMCQKFHRDA